MRFVLCPTFRTSPYSQRHPGIQSESTGILPSMKCNIFLSISDPRWTWRWIETKDRSLYSVYTQVLWSLRPWGFVVISVISPLPMPLHATSSFSSSLPFFPFLACFSSLSKNDEWNGYSLCQKVRLHGAVRTLVLAYHTKQSHCSLASRPAIDVNITVQLLFFADKPLYDHCESLQDHVMYLNIKL